MQTLRDRTAFVTGAASGFGLALAIALLDEGMQVVIADLRAEGLAAASRQLSAGRGAQVSTVTCDVTNRESLQLAAAHTFKTFGNVHLVCNNAGVLAPGPLESASTQDWMWSFGVNVMGAIHGIETFVPHMRAHGEGGHVLNTASMAGFRGLPNAAAYCATKAAVVSLSESLAAELAMTNIGVTVLCPGFMRTRLYQHGFDRPDQYGGRKATILDANPSDPAPLRDAIAGGIGPEWVARRAIRAIRENELYVVTHPQHRADIAAKSEQLLAAYDRAAQEIPT